MRTFFHSLSLFTKVMILTLCITFAVVFSTGGISLYLQTNHMKDHLMDTVTGLSTLWSLTINGEEVKKLSETGNMDDPAFTKIYEQLSLISDQKSQFYHAFIVKPELINNEIYTIVASRACEHINVTSFSSYSATESFKNAFIKAVESGATSVSKMYSQYDKKWLSSFTPIFTQDGDVVGVLVITTEATVIETFHREILSYFSVIFFIILIIVYLIFKISLKRVLEPVDIIMYGINEVSHGNFRVKLPVKDQSDLGVLTERFNFMTEQLSILFDRLSHTSNRIGKVESNLPRNTVFEEAIGEMENIIQRTKILKELQRAEKMNAIGQLAASVAHEIRNPMTVVKGFLQIFQVKEELSEEERTFVKLMIEEMDRAETIINDYLSLAKPDFEHTEKVDATKLALKSMELMNSYAKMSKNIELETKIEDEVYVLGNRSELNQVLINVLKNGIEAMKDGGLLTLKVYQHDSYGVFEISDTGIGMTPEEIERLGTAFYSLKEKGTGIGLMVCYQIVERMKGRIEVRSEKGKGTTFIIYVPLYIDVQNEE